MLGGSVEPTDPNRRHASSPGCVTLFYAPNMPTVVPVLVGISYERRRSWFAKFALLNTTLAITLLLCESWTTLDGWLRPIPVQTAQLDLWIACGLLVRVTRLLWNVASWTLSSNQSHPHSLFNLHCAVN